MAECLACEKFFDPKDSVSSTYCSPECETVFTAALKESAEESKIKGLIDVEGNSILGGAYQQAVERTIRMAQQSIGIKLPPRRED